MIFMAFVIFAALFVMKNPHDLPVGPVKSREFYERMKIQKNTEKTTAEIN